MKVYELMGKLSKMNAGAEVRFRRIFSLEEVDIYDDDSATYEIDVCVKEVERRDERKVYLDGWAN